MRVLMKKYEEESKVQCTNCETLLAYGKSDVYDEDDDLFGVINVDASLMPIYYSDFFHADVRTINKMHYQI